MKSPGRWRDISIQMLFADKLSYPQNSHSRFLVPIQANCRRPVTVVFCLTRVHKRVRQELETYQVYSLVKELSEIPGPIGHEDPVQDWVAKDWATFSESVRRTRVDNVLAKVGGSGRKLVLVAHADEICFMVKSISDEGFLHIWPYYSDTVKRPPSWLSATGQPALVVSSDGLTEGVFATASGHVAGGRAGGKEHAEWNDWFIDIGVSSRAEAEALGIGAGSRAIWNPQTRQDWEQHYRQGHG